MRKRGGFTLAEMMLTLALVAIVYTIISTILIQLGRYVRDGRQVARERLEFLRSIEDFRYQMRSLYFTPDSTVGLKGLRSSTDKQDTLCFLTTNGKLHKGVVEVGYRISDYVDDKDPTKNGSALYYREFPFPRDELRTLDAHQEAPWKMYLRNVDVFELQYSNSGLSWQREWDLPSPPAVVRVHMERVGKIRERMVFDVTPGLGATRW